MVDGPMNKISILRFIGSRFSKIREKRDEYKSTLLSKGILK